MSKTTNKYSPEVRERAVRLVLGFLPSATSKAA
jgi:transposase-like protein